MTWLTMRLTLDAAPTTPGTPHSSTDASPSSDRLHLTQADSVMGELAVGSVSGAATKDAEARLAPALRFSAAPAVPKASATKDRPVASLMSANAARPSADEPDSAKPTPEPEEAEAEAALLAFALAACPDAAAAARSGSQPCEAEMKAAEPGHALQAATLPPKLCRPVLHAVHARPVPNCPLDEKPARQPHVGLDAALKLPAGHTAHAAARASE